MALNEYTPEDKLGHISEIEEKVVWPKVDVMGRNYERPVSLAMIGKISFVVIPRMVTPEVLAAIEEVKASVIAKPAIEPVVEVEEAPKKGK